MAAGTISDYTVLAALTEEYAQTNFYRKLSLVSSGIAVSDTDVNFNVSMGNTFKVRGYKANYDDWSTLVAATDLAINNIDTYVQTGIIARRGNALGVEEAARYAGGDAEDLIAQEMADQVANQAGSNLERTVFQKLMPALFDVTNGALKNSHLVTCSGVLTNACIEDALGLTGENRGEYEYMFMHPSVYKTFRKSVLLTEDWDTRREFHEMGLMWGGRFGGVNIILNSRLYETGGRYQTLLFKKGALMLGYQKDLHVDAFRDKLLAGGTDVVTYTLYFSPHVFFTSFTGTAPTALTGASDANIALATNWSSVAADASQIGVACITSTLV